MSRARLAPLVAACVLALHQAMDTTSLVASGRIETPEPDGARMLALGFEPVIADYYWIQALQVVGRQASGAGDTELVRELIDLVLTLDPWVDHPYRFAAHWLDRTPHQVRFANAKLEQGIAYHPSDWRNRFYLGYNLFFHLGQHARAAHELEGALAFEGAPNYLGALVTRLKASAGSLDAAALFLHELVEQTEDDYKKAEYGKAFDEIETERRARYLDRAREEFRRRHGRDIARVEELWSGPQRVIERPPPPHPHFPGFAWELQPESGEIVSSAYGARYELHFHQSDLERQRRWDEEYGESGVEESST